MVERTQNQIGRKTAFEICGREAYLDMIKRGNEKETYVFFRAPRRFRKSLVYGFSYDVESKEIVGFDKFSDRVSEIRHPSFVGSFCYANLPRSSGSLYNISGTQIWPYEQYKGIIKECKFDRELKDSERSDLEKIAETLRVSHSDFSVHKNLLKCLSWVPERSFREYYEDYEREIESLGDIPGVAGALIALGKHRQLAFYSEIPGLSARLEIKGAMDAIELQRLIDEDSINYIPFQYGGWNTLRIKGKKVYEISANSPIHVIDRTTKNGACFIIEEGTMATFLDKEGNKTFPIGFPDGLSRRHGQFVGKSGELLDYNFINFNNRELLDSSGKPIGKLNEEGFIYPL